MKFISQVVLVLLFSTLICNAQESELLEQARDLFNKNDYSSASDKLNALLFKDPGNIKALKLRAACYVKVGNVEKAINDLESVFKSDSNDVSSNLLLGKLYGKKNHYDKAVTILNYNQELKKVPLDNQYYLAYYQILSGQSEEAAKFIDKLFTSPKNQGDPLLFYLHGLAFDSLKNVNKADNKYSSAIGLLPPSIEDYNDKYEDLAELFPYIKYYEARAGRLMQDKLYDQALELYKKCFQLDSNSFDLRFKIGLCNYELGRFVEAREYFLGCQKMMPTRPEVYFYLGQIEFMNLRYGESSYFLKKAIDLKDTNPRCYLLLGHCAYEQRNYSEAKKYYKKTSEVLDSLSISDVEWKSFKENQKHVNAIIWLDNKEYNIPQVVITRPLNIKKDRLSWNRGSLRRVEFIIKDQSGIKFVKVNSDTIATDTTEINPVFVYNFKAADTLGHFIFRDVYDNEETATFMLLASDSIYIDINTPPVNSKNEIVPDDPFVEMIKISGTISTEMPMISININGHETLVDSLNINPGFSVDIPLSEITDSIRIIVTDQDRITLYYSYYFNLKQAHLNASNTIMGKTWFVFIENSDYENENSLKGPERDYLRIKNALNDYKIDEVFHRKNLKKDEFDKYLLKELLDRVRKSNVRSLVIWYAGHGYSDGEDAYWIPVDGEKTDLSSLYSTDALIHALRKFGVNHLLVVTDACQAGASVRGVRSGEDEKLCDPQNLKNKSAQILTSSTDGNSNDKSEFASYFANILETDLSNCISVETVAKRMKDHFKNGIQEPQFGPIEGLEDFDGTFFFLKK